MDIDEDREQWERVGERVRERRQLLGWTMRQAVERSAGLIKDSTWSSIERNTMPGRYSARSLYGVCTALGWMPDGIDAILSGQEPRIRPGWEGSVESRIDLLEARVKALTEVVEALVADVASMLNN